MGSVDGLYEAALAICDGEHPDEGRARNLLQRAADGGDARATYALANWLLHDGAGAENEPVKAAVVLLRSVEEANIAEALFDLAVCYDYGRGVRKNEKRAFSLYMRSALLGHPESCEQIAEFYRHGKIVPHDRKLYKAWLARAGEEPQSISPPYRVWLRPPGVSQ